MVKIKRGIKKGIKRGKLSCFFSKKRFFIGKLKENKIEIVYVVKPLWGGDDVFEKGLEKDCIKKIKITEVLDSYLLKECEDLKN